MPGRKGIGALCGTASSVNSVIEPRGRVTAGVGLKVITGNTRRYLARATVGGHVVMRSTLMARGCGQ